MTDKLTLEELQSRVNAWLVEHGGYWGKFQILAHLTEELGEVAAALQRAEGLKPRSGDAHLAEEVGDLLFTLTVFANACELNLQDAVQSVLEKYTARDSAAFKARQTREKDPG